MYPTPVYPPVQGEINGPVGPQGQISEYMVCNKVDAAKVIADFAHDLGGSLPSQSFALYEGFTQAAGGEWYSYQPTETRRAWCFNIFWNDGSEQTLFCQQLLTGQQASGIGRPGAFELEAKNGPIIWSAQPAPPTTATPAVTLASVKAQIVALQQLEAVLSA